MGPTVRILKLASFTEEYMRRISLPVYLDQHSLF